MRKDYGTKYICFNCSAKFYDLGRPQAICPICETDQEKRPKKKDKRAARNYETPKTPPEASEPAPMNSGEGPLADTAAPGVDDGAKVGATPATEETGG